MRSSRKVVSICEDPHFADYAEIYTPQIVMVARRPNRNAELVARGVLILGVVALAFLFWWKV